MQNDDQIDIEISGARDEAHNKGIRAYLMEEGILQAIMQGWKSADFDNVSITEQNH